jgi:hypothetical protein
MMVLLQYTIFVGRKEHQLLKIRKCKESIMMLFGKFNGLEEEIMVAIRKPLFPYQLTHVLWSGP